MVASALHDGSSSDSQFLAAFRAGTLTPAPAEVALLRDRSAVIFLMLQLSAVVAAGTGTPASGRTHAFRLPAAVCQANDQGTRQKTRRPERPTQIDRYETDQLPACPDCGEPLKRTGQTRTRILEDIPEDRKAEAVEHTIHRDWCPCCKKQVEPKVSDALPNCTLGHRTVVFAAWLYYGLAVTISLIGEAFVQVWRVSADVRGVRGGAGGQQSSRA
ncbi:MAG: hypothetical protein EXS09_09850 [Gemmataceae bacterium]|nr:hypothetical protein [Gemmataceae bacterium]